MALGLGSILGIASGLGGLFQKKPSNPYTGQVNSTLASQKGLAGQYGNMARQYGQAYTGLNTQQNASYGQLRDALQANPYTDSYTTGLRNRALASNQDAGRQAQAALTANMAARGLSGSGMEAGGLAAILGQQVAADNTFNNNLAIQGGQQHLANLQTLYGLDNDRANTAYGQQQAALGNQANLNSGVLSLLANLSAGRDAQIQQQQAQQAAGLGALGSLIPDVNLGGLGGYRLPNGTRTGGTPPIVPQNNYGTGGYQPVTVPGLNYRFR